MLKLDAILDEQHSQNIFTSYENQLKIFLQIVSIYKYSTVIKYKNYLIFATKIVDYFGGVCPQYNRYCFSAVAIVMT
jgi:hypothetical protein